MVHKLLAIEEDEGAKDANYSIRAIQSSKYLSIASTGKDPETGKQRTEEYKVKGPVGVIITTTDVDLDYETASRFIHMTIDESREATQKIHEKQREADTLEGLFKSLDKDKITKKHYNAQRLLKSVKVVNPYSLYLTFTNETLRTRRDHKKYLNLIKAIAFVHQHQREIKTATHKSETVQYIEVTLSDVEKANKLANAILGQSLNELAPPSQTLLKHIHNMVIEWSGKNKKKVNTEDLRFNRKDIREYCKWSDYQVRIHIKQLEELGYVYPVMGRRGKEYFYELSYNGEGEDGNPFMVGLISIEELKKAAKEEKHGVR